MNTFNDKLAILTCFAYYVYVYFNFSSLDFTSQMMTIVFTSVIFTTNVLLVGDVAKSGGFLKENIFY